MGEENAHKIKIFFDESGKGRDYPNLMGGLSIPDKCYIRDEFAGLYQLITDGKPIHWTEYTGDGKARWRIVQLLETMMPYADLIKFNCISYKMNQFEELGKPMNSFFPNIADETIYTKIPERVIYGLLRKYGQDTYIDASVYVEHDNSYEQKHLKERMLEQLNIQSLYRAERYCVSSVEYLLKQKEFGMELTDVILGIIRTIIQNSTATSRAKQKKNELVLSLLKDIPNLEEFLKNKVRLYEWNSPAKELMNIPFENYLSVFKSTQI